MVGASGCELCTYMSSRRCPFLQGERGEVEAKTRGVWGEWRAGAGHEQENRGTGRLHFTNLIPPLPSPALPPKFEPPLPSPLTCAARPRSAGPGWASWHPAAWPHQSRAAGPHPEGGGGALILAWPPYPPPHHCAHSVPYPLTMAPPSSLTTHLPGKALAVHVDREVRGIEVQDGGARLSEQPPGQCVGGESWGSRMWLGQSAGGDLLSPPPPSLHTIHTFTLLTPKHSGRQCELAPPPSSPHQSHCSHLKHSGRQCELAAGSTPMSWLKGENGSPGSKLIWGGGAARGGGGG